MASWEGEGWPREETVTSQSAGIASPGNPSAASSKARGHTRSGVLLLLSMLRMF